MGIPENMWKMTRNQKFTCVTSLKLKEILYFISIKLPALTSILREAPPGNEESPGYSNTSGLHSASSSSR